MKRFSLSLFAFLFVLVASAQQTRQNTEGLIKLSTENHDFGKIKQGTPVSYYFELTNVSQMPLVIENATSTCGCTVPEYPKDPIAPGETIKMKVQYNAASPGHFEKDVFVKFAGVTEPKKLHIKGDVVGGK